METLGAFHKSVDNPGIWKAYDRHIWMMPVPNWHSGAHDNVILYTYLGISKPALQVAFEAQSCELRIGS